MKFRGLRADEIEVRVGSITRNGASLLLYKDARCDMNILDEVFGPMWWQRRHEVINGNLYCGIGIYNNDIKDWVWKWDCGIESRADGEGNEKKGEASDSFKRAAFNIGIGRELYTAGFIFIKCETEPIQNSNRYKLKNSYEFSGAYVSHIEYKENEYKREITGLIIKNSKGEQIFAKKGEKVDNGEVTEEEILKLFALAEQAGYSKDTVFKQVKEKYKKEVENLKKAEYNQLFTGYTKLVKMNEKK